MTELMLEHDQDRATTDILVRIDDIEDAIIELKNRTERSTLTEDDLESMMCCARIEGERDAWREIAKAMLNVFPRG